MRSLLAKAYSASQEVGTWAAHGFPLAERESRLAICRACEQFEADHCKLCGCYMPAKAALATACCPAGKWHGIPMQQNAPAARSCGCR
jgi:hypothetical protein